MKSKLDAQEEDAASFKGRIVFSEEKVRHSEEAYRVREAAALSREQELTRRLEVAERRLEERWRWERASRRREQRAENAARIWEAFPGNPEVGGRGKSKVRARVPD